MSYKKTDNMKKAFFLLSIIRVLCSCNMTPQSKAKELIKDAVKKTLYHEDSYDPVETVIDSAFSPKDDPAFHALLKDVLELSVKLKMLEATAETAKTGMSIWRGPLMTDLSRNEYNNSKKEYEETTEKIDQCKKRGKKKAEKLLSMLVADPQFMGYKVYHSYRAQDNEGQINFGNKIFIIDKEMKKVLYTFEKEEYDEIQEAIASLEEEIQEEDED